MLYTADLKAWLAPQVPGAVVYTVDEATSLPDRQVIVELTGGAGTVHERSYDLQTVQVRTRGGQRNRDDAERLAALVDDAFMGAATPVEIGVRVIAIDRVGGPPAFLSRDESQRTMFSCNYLLQVARSVF